LVCVDPGVNRHFHGIKTFSVSHKPQEQALSQRTREELKTDEHDSSSLDTKSRTEFEIRRSAEELTTRVNETRRKIRDNQSADTHEKHAAYKLKNYEALFRSWNLTEGTISDSLKILQNRDRNLDAIDDKILDREIDRFEGVRLKKSYRIEAEKELAKLMGPESSVKFSVWDKMPSTIQKKSNLN